MSGAASSTTGTPPSPPASRSRLLAALSVFLLAALVTGSWWTFWNLPHPRVRVIGTAEQRAAVLDAVEHYRQAGLDLPAVQVHFSDDPSDCGRYGHGLSYERWPHHDVWLCTNSERVLYHELAHVWTYGHLNDAARVDFTYYRSATDWNGADLSWPEKASEHAAELIAWYVSGGRFEPRLGVVATPEIEPAWAWLLARSGVRLMD